jgi:DNA polymerase-4
MILHVDMDAFFAAVEQLSDPRTLGRPLLVCGDPEGRSVVAAASYEARPFGVHAGMPVRRARALCPEAVLVEGDPVKYVAISLRLLEVFKRFTPLVEPMSIDEAFLDLRGTPYDGARAPEAARALQGAVERETRLTCSVGIGPNKLVAKMASGLVKPRGLTALDLDEFRRRFWPQPAPVLWGIGEKTGEALAAIGIRTIGDLANAPEAALTTLFGVMGPRMRYAARGEDESAIVPYFEGLPNRSMGHEHTLSRDSDDREEIEDLVLGLSDRLARRMRREGYRGKVVVVKMRSADFILRQRQRALPEPTDDERMIARTARLLLRAHWRGDPLRLVGVAMGGLQQNAPAVDPLFERDRHCRRMTMATDGVRDRFGEQALLRAATLRSAEAPPIARR